MDTPAPQKRSLQCTSCQRALSVPVTASGKVVVCPCGKKLKVPNAPPSAPASIFDAELPTSPTPYRPPANPNARSPGNASAAMSDVGAVTSGQRFLVFAIIGYLCSLPVLVLANAFLGGTPEKPVVTAAFGLVLGTGLLGMFAAASVACFGILRMGRVIFPESTRIIYAVGVLVPAPLIGLLVMFVANSKATGYLKAKGVAVGLFGAKG